ncbi:hypothetical protein C8F04DRAFT_979767 [Mycena alexandri]|uniref:Uncharacterized protein n=1 Tax=Mycena alexandri TaxID=1745969 RepID=A0AAD6S1K9_9AGAR|nr:hypothetical protein C8F04DRAFT_979767 [Mycena alexandri]
MVEEEGGVQKWAADAQVNLLAGGGGEVWAKVVNMWWKREEANKFQGPAKGKGVSLRPKEVSGWVSRAHSGGPHPAIVDTISFAVRWWNWWGSINPEWQVRKGNRLLREGEGSWDPVAQTGPNGMLNVLICLRWWYDALKGDEGAIGEWKEALSDVEWALKGIM